MQHPAQGEGLRAMHTVGRTWKLRRKGPGPAGKGRMKRAEAQTGGQRQKVRNTDRSLT